METNKEVIDKLQENIEDLTEEYSNIKEENQALYIEIEECK